LSFSIGTLVPLRASVCSTGVVKRAFATPVEQTEARNAWDRESSAGCVDNKWLAAVQACPSVVAGRAGLTAPLVVTMALPGMFFFRPFSSWVGSRLAASKARPMKMLIADDDPISLKMLDGLLTAWGYHVVTATDGTEAWQVLQDNEAPKLAILDRSMPGLDGLEICRRLRQKPTPTYVLLLTGHAAKADIVIGLEAGANDYVTKPFDVDELRARVQAGRTLVELQANQRRAEEQLNRFFDLSLDLFCIAHVNGSFLRVNSNFTRLLGYSNEELLSRPFFDIIQPSDVQCVRDQVERLATGEVVIDFRCRMLDNRGNDHWIEWNARAIPEDGTIYAVGRDISERLRMESELRYRESRERSLLDNMPAIINVKGTDGRYEFVNRRHAELFSGSPEAAVGKRAQDYFPEEDADRFDQEDRQVLKTGETASFETIVRQEDGAHTYLCLKFPLHDVNARACAVACIATDITEQLRARQTEQELAIARSFQSKLYPKSAPAVGGVDVVGSAIPLTQLCGDYYDYVKLGPSRLMLSIGDVSGHGVGPALEMAEVRCTVRILARLGHDIPSIMGDLNRMLCEDLPESAFVSFFLADIDVENRQLRYLGAGHDAVLLRADGTECRLKSTHPLLGIA